jgi:hypothetical protein
MLCISETNNGSEKVKKKKVKKKQRLFVSGGKTEAQVSVFLYYVIQYQQQSYLSGENKSRICGTKRGQQIVFTSSFLQGRFSSLYF